MKRRVLSGLLAAALLLTCALTGCGPSEGTEPSPDGSRPLYFKETHRLDPNDESALCAVTVDRVLDHLYTVTSFDSIAVLATVEEVFWCGRGPVLSPGDQVVLWIHTTDLWPDAPREEYKAAVQTLRDILGAADALVVFGDRFDPRLAQRNDQNYTFWKEDTQGLEYDLLPDGLDQYRLDMPPSFRLTGLSSWRVLPIKDGVLDAAPIQELIDSVDIREMAFPLDQELPKGGQYFKDGDSAEDVYQAMREYAQKYG